MISLQSKDSRESSLAPQLKSINSLAVSLLYGPTLTSVHDYWKNLSFDYTELYGPLGFQMIFMGITVPTVREMMDIYPAPGILTYNSVIVLTWESF